MPKYALINELQHSIISFGLIKENYISIDNRRVTLQDKIVFITQKCKTLIQTYDYAIF